MSNTHAMYLACVTQLHEIGKGRKCVTKEGKDGDSNSDSRMTYGESGGVSIGVWNVRRSGGDSPRYCKQ